MAVRHLPSAIGLALLTTACASLPVRTGQTYLVQWPSVPPDLVVIERGPRMPRGWVVCRSVDDDVVWACNLNAALYVAAVDAITVPYSREQVRHAPE